MKHSKNKVHLHIYIINDYVNGKNTRDDILSYPLLYKNTPNFIFNCTRNRYVNDISSDCNQDTYFQTTLQLSWTTLILTFKLLLRIGSKYEAQKNEKNLPLKNRLLTT